MVKRLIAFLLTACCCCLQLACAGEADGSGKRDVVVKLRDGSEVVGELVRVEDEQYFVRTESLGPIKIRADVILSIVFDTAAADRQPGAPDTTRSRASSGGTDDGAATSLFGLDAILKAMTSDSSIMEKINQLKDDPDVKAVLEDPGVLQALESGDVSALFDNAKVRSLLENDVVKSISEDYRKKSNAGNGREASSTPTR